jgi:membrane-associated phospholipid phosphatase
MRLIFLIAIFLGYGLNQTQAQNKVDIQLLEHLHISRNTNLDKPLNILGSSTYPLLVGSSALYIFKSFNKKEAWQLKTVEFHTSLLGAAVLGYGLKYGVNRNRPENNVFENFNVSPYYSSSSGSFPSGHTTMAFSWATNIHLHFPEKKWLIAGAYAFSGTVAYSRLHNGHHYFTDVIAGALIGSTLSYLNIKFNRKLNNRISDKVWKNN